MADPHSAVAHAVQIKQCDQAEPVTNISSRQKTNYPTNVDNGEAIQKSYRELVSRRVDLVGDYAGHELFLIEGDSLLLHCFDDDKLDFDPGLQLLHAVYNVESFLANLIKRKCNFRIVFFQNNSLLCVPGTASKNSVDKYMLARAVMIRHLTECLPLSQPDVKVTIYESWHSQSFINDLTKSPPYFVMAHDGAAALKGRKTDMGKETGAQTIVRCSQLVAFRHMILFFIGQNISVALVNELQWRDTKVITDVLEARNRRTIHHHHPPDDVAVSSVATIDLAASLQAIHEYIPRLSERQLLTTIVVATLLLEEPDGISVSDWVDLCSTFLLHQVLLTNLPLHSRRLPEVSSDNAAQNFLSQVSKTAVALLQYSQWHTNAKISPAHCDIADFVDGRLFLHLRVRQVQLDEPSMEIWDAMNSAVSLLSHSQLPCSRIIARPGSDDLQCIELHKDCSPVVNTSNVLPFSNAVFDDHMQSVHIKIDMSRQVSSPGSQKIFNEVSHWHNSKSLLPRKGAIQDPDATRLAAKRARRNQRYMAEMQTYAASLTDAVGKVLSPQAIFVQSPKDDPAPSLKAVHRPRNQRDSIQDKDSGAAAKIDKKQTGGAKSAAINSSKQAMRDRIAADSAKKAEAMGQKKSNSWRDFCKTLEVSDPLSRRTKAQIYLAGLRPEEKAFVGSEIELYMANCLVQYWMQICLAGTHSQHMYVPAMIWNHMRVISLYPNLPKSVSKGVRSIVGALMLPELPLPTEGPITRDLAFSLAPPNTTSDLSVNISSTIFQLLHCGPYLERSFDSAPDERVDFQPDEWQKIVLDSIDANQSVFVVAPTSAGKTFISFYAMRKVLEADDEGVLIYVAPTKALVNQIAAEIQAKYSKNFKHGGKSVWAISTRDHRVNNANGCQILVTVPHMLQIMLLAPSNATSWSRRVKRIIFDEIHTIGQADDGVVWEQLLLMAPCPIIGLSATVGNPDDFSQWLETTQQANGHDLLTVHHPYRYSDLRKYYYVPPRQFQFAGIPKPALLSGLGLDDLPGLKYIHPVAALTEVTRGIPDDLSLESHDCYQLWRAMKKVAFGPFTIPNELDPEISLPEVCRKVDILGWERSLKALLRQWLEDSSSPYGQLLHEIELSFRNPDREAIYLTQTNESAILGQEFMEQDEKEYVSLILPLLCRLHEHNALPAIVFNYDRLQCEQHARSILDQLQLAEKQQKKSGPKWERQLEQWEEWKRSKAKQHSAATKDRATRSNKKGKADHSDGDKVTKNDIQRESATRDDDTWEWFDPLAPAHDYTFADYTKVQLSEVADYVSKLEYQEVQPWLIDALKRGIGVHHAGMPRAYRTCVEMLFRKRFLRVVVATGTLALGINMPCKTVIFSGDSVFLTALNYRQRAGRAGRRGFDLLGNVVFHGISREKVCRLISSRLPDLNGHFPITTSLVLRLFNLLHDSAQSPYAVQVVNSLLAQPRLYMGGESFKDQTMHHLRFSIEYLRRQNLLASDGTPLNFAGLVSHLYYTENSSFAFHALLKEGYFNELCAKIVGHEEETLRTLMLVMSHLFHRRTCRRSELEYKAKHVKSSSSIIFLPSLPVEAADILEDHNRQTLRVYETYVRTFIGQHINDLDNTLPLSGIQFGGQVAASTIDGSDSLSAISIRSSFVALSGHADTFVSIHDLCTTVRAGVFLEEAVIPYLPVTDELDVPLNAWLYDFYKHGNVHAIEDANGIRRSDIWFLLNDFSLVLATIVTSLTNFLKVGNVNISDIQASGDRMDEVLDDKLGEKEEKDAERLAGSAGNHQSVTRKQEDIKKISQKAPIADSWDDEAGGDDGAAEVGALMMGSHGHRTRSDAHDTDPAWNLGTDDGLLSVLKTFQKLQSTFDSRFKAMWA